jgi:hypothetical protein
MDDPYVMGAMVMQILDKTIALSVTSGSATAPAHCSVFFMARSRRSALRCRRRLCSTSTRRSALQGDAGLEHGQEPNGRAEATNAESCRQDHAAKCRSHGDVMSNRPLTTEIPTDPSATNPSPRHRATDLFGDYFAAETAASNCAAVMPVIISPPVPMLNAAIGRRATPCGVVTSTN